MLDQLRYYFTFPFVQYSLIVGVLISVCCALFGVVLVLKRFSLIGDGLSHVAFGATSVASVLKLTVPLPFVFIVTIVVAIFLLGVGENRRLQGDSAIAILSVSSLAGGYLCLNLFSHSANLTADVCSTLFGSTSILTLSQQDVWTCVILAVLVVGLFLFFYHKIFAITFDENFATATGTRSSLYRLALAVIIAVIIVLALNLVGSLLISALVVFPVLSAMEIFLNFRNVCIYSAIFSVVCTVLGILISILAGTPVGATIVIVDLAGFLISALVGRLYHKICR